MAYHHHSLRAVMGLIVATLPACSGARFNLHVERPPGVAPTRFFVRMSSAHGSCRGGYYDGETDTAGNLSVMSETCGVSRLYVSGRGIETFTQVIDSCDRQRLVVHPSKARPWPLDDCGRTALTFLESSMKGDTGTMRTLLYEPETAPARAWREEWVRPREMYIGEVRTLDHECHAVAILAFDGACDEKWRITLRRVGSDWRVLDDR